MSGMQLRWIAEYHGPNPYALSPVVVAELGKVCKTPAMAARCETVAT